MILKDFKVNDRVLVYTNENNVLSDATHVGPCTVECTILRITDMDVTIGWRAGEPQPRPNVMVDVYTIEGYGNCYPGFIAWIKASTKRLSAGITISDGPCRQCSKKNSSQDKKCWWCQVSCPTDLKRTGP